MTTQTIPELALSESSSSSSAYHEVAYDPATFGPWVDDEDEPVLDEADVPPVLTPWNASGWDDMAMVHVWAAAKEEYMMHHDPGNPYVPFKADRDLVDLSKQRTPDSWKIKMQANEQLERERVESSGLPPPGAKETTSLWYSSLFRPPPPAPKRKKQVKKTKMTHQSDAPMSPDPYTPQSPPAFAPASPTASTSALPEPEIGGVIAIDDDSAWQASWAEDAGEVDYEDEWEEEPYGGVAASGPIQLDFGAGAGGSNGHWDDGDLVKGWEREKKQWEAKHGKGKSWLDQAMEDAAAAAAAASTPPAAPLPPPGPALDKIARRNLERFGRATGAPVAATVEPEELSYD